MKLARVAGLVTLALMITLSPLPASPATKYKPCTLLAAADLEAILNAKVTKTQGENEDVGDEGPLKGETIDTCAWILGAVPIGVVLRVSRAVAPLPQMAQVLFTPLEESAQKDGTTIERAKGASSDCRIFKNIKVMNIKNSTDCLTAGKGLALLIEINTGATAPVTVAAAALLVKAVSRLP